MTAWLLLGCRGETGVGVASADKDPLRIALSVLPAEIDFGTVDKGAVAGALATVHNDGDIWLDVGFLVDGDGGFAVAAGPLSLAPGEAATWPLTFSPVAPFAAAARLVAFAEIEGGPAAEADLVGAGASPVISLSVEPPGDAVVYCDPSVGTVEVSNDGGHDLWIEAVDQVGGWPAFLLAPDALPANLAPGEKAVWPVSFLPTAVGPQQGVWVIRSNDPDLPSAGVSVAAQGVYAGDERVDDFVVAPRTLSMLIAMDRSGSMDDDLAVVQPAMERLIDEIGTVVPDWRIGIVTGVSACVNEGVLTPDTPELHATFVEAMLGEGSELTEALLALAADAAEAPCNAGLWLPGEPVQVVVVSDEPEQSGDWEGQVARIADAVGDAWLVHISGVVDVNGTCGDGAAGYVEAADETSGVLLDICDSGLVDDVLDLLVPHAYGVDTFVLSEPPNEASLSATVDGLPWDVVYDAAVVAVRLVPAPPVGADVEIRWFAATCPS